MLNDDDLERAACKLADFRLDSALGNILDQYCSLIESYKQLKSDYEEERETREKYKRMAKGRGGKPFVLVLVNGDDYLFHDHLVGDGESGGHAAAEMLRKAVMSSPRWKDLDHCDIMVRVYADSQNHDDLMRETEGSPTSMFYFAAGFNRSTRLFDFVDSGDLENTEAKLRATLDLYATSPQCKHIFFAGCHDGRYVNDVAKYADKRERFTLIANTGRGLPEGYSELGMGLETYSGVFRAQDYPTEYPISVSRSGSVSTASTPYWWTVTPQPFRKRAAPASEQDEAVTAETVPVQKNPSTAREEAPAKKIPSQITKEVQGKGSPGGGAARAQRKESAPKATEAALAKEALTEVTGEAEEKRQAKDSQATATEKVQTNKERSATTTKEVPTLKVSPVVTTERKNPGAGRGKQKQSCRFLEKYGHCKFGDRCWGLHPKQ
ncbi:hypothetical protein J3F83DRAFT_746640 [Trichoderma novae-zelandiae]